MSLFLLDKDSHHLAAVIGGITYAQADVPEQHEDLQIVEKAWDLERTIVTCNQSDYVRDIYKFQRKQQESICHDLYGLLIVPNPRLETERLWAKIRHGIQVTGGPNLSWNEVNDHNLYVRVTKSGRPEIRRFPICHYCVKFKLRDNPKWLQDLPVVGNPSD